MPWSIFSQGGGSGAAVTWAQDLEGRLGIPVNAPDTQFIYDWEVSEGGGGKFNPLNQGPVPGHPELTSTGPQFGGGAADFVSWDAGLTGASDYIHFSNYSGVLQGLKDQNYTEAEHALWASPWAQSHYGYGSRWNTSAPPGATPIPGINSATLLSSPSGSTPSGGGGGNPPVSSGSNPLSVWNLLGIPDPIDVLERLGLVLLGALLILLGIYMLAGRQAFVLAGKGFASGPSQAETQRNQERRRREAVAEQRRNRREARQGEAGGRQERALGLRERRVNLAEQVEKRKRGELGVSLCR